MADRCRHGGPAGVAAAPARSCRDGVTAGVGRALVSSRRGTPPRRRVLADAAVDGLSDEVGMPRVAAVLLHEVAQQAPQVGVVALGVVSRDRLVEAAAREDRGQPRA